MWTLRLQAARPYAAFEKTLAGTKTRWMSAQHANVKDELVV